MTLRSVSYLRISARPLSGRTRLANAWAPSANAPLAAPAFPRWAAEPEMAFKNDAPRRNVQPFLNPICLAFCPVGGLPTRHSFDAMIHIDFHRLRFLVVDDNAHMRRIVRTLLNSFGVRDIVEAE